MEDAPIVLRFEGSWPTLNEYIRAERGNRYAAATLKQRYTAQACYEALAGYPPTAPKPIPGPMGLDCIWYAPSRRSDLDNLSFGLKFILDGLVHAGILRSDNLREITRITHTFALGERGVEIVLRKEG